MAESKYKPLSFSTTMRSPERIANFLNCIIPFENQKLDNTIIHKIIINIIKNKLYKTNFERRKYKKELRNEEFVISEDIAEYIIEHSPQNHKEAGFDKGWPSRFDTIFKLSKEFGFLYYEVGKPIEITRLGHMLIDALNEKPVNSKKIQDVFLNSMVKYQINNPYRKNLNNNVPLLLLLQVIDLLKKDPEENGSGVFKKELSLFICWPNDNAYELYEKIKEIRKKVGYSYSDEYIYDICLELLGTDNKTYIKMDKVCNEAVDEYIRKMRITGVISLRGNGRFLDFNMLEKNKIEYILSRYLEYETYTDCKEYTKYMGKIDSNLLTFQNNEGINVEEIKQYTLKKFAQKYSKEDIYKELRRVCAKKESEDEVLRFISAPVRLEFLTSISLLQHFKDLVVKPNYPVDDEGLPTSTAGGDMADIVCQEETYESNVEVTLMCGRSDQVNNEIVPIRRHLLKLKEENQKSFAILLAPIIHEDTVQVAWLYKERENLDILTYDLESFLKTIKNISKLSDALSLPDKLRN